METGKLAAALAEAQGDFNPITKNRTVRVQTSKGSYTFTYADLDAIFAATKPALKKNGLAVLMNCSTAQEPPVEIDGGFNATAIRVSVTPSIYHSSGESLKGDTMSAVLVNPKLQEIGSALTYLKRYAYTGLLCLSAEDDDDGNAADGNHVEQERKPEKNSPVDTLKVILNDRETTPAMKAKIKAFMAESHVAGDYASFLKEILAGAGDDL